MLTRRAGIYYYRRAIPRLLRQSLGRREFIISLKTRETTLALQRAHQVDITCNRIIKNAKSGEITLCDFDELKKSITKFETETRTIEQPDGTKTTVSTNRIDPNVISAMRDAGVSPDQIALTVRQFLEGTGQLPPADTKTTANLQQMRNNVTLSDYIKRYISDWERMEGRELDSRKKTQLRRLQEVLPADKTICNVNRDDAITVRDALTELPKKTKKYAGMPVEQIIATALSEDPDYVRINATTIERYFETYHALFKQASEDDLYSGRNPFKGVMMVTGGESERRREKRRRAAASREAYTEADLKKMFSTDLYIGYGERPYHEGMKFWIPLIGLLTGSRMSQIASLYCDDIKVESGIPVIDFNDKTADKTGKTDVSFRSVPIHPILLKLGLIEYAEKVGTYNIPSDFGGGSRLFPELRTFARGTYAKRFEDWFNRHYLVDLQIRKSGDNKAFHAFRATLLGLLKDADIDEHTRNHIIGWSRNEEMANLVVREHYDRVTLERMRDALNSINLPEIFNKIPPFPVHRDMNFGRRYRNQHIKK